MSARPRPEWVSPSLAAIPNGVIPAFEMKFFVPEATARDVEAWAGQHLTLDPHADPTHGYRTTTMYFDTPQFDVYQRTADYRRDKYRVRRYGTDPAAHLERKSKEDGRVWKFRTTVPFAEVAAVLAGGGPPAAHWFTLELADLGLRPVCRVSYNRTAFVGLGASGPVRVTLDRSVCGAAIQRVNDEVNLTPIVTDGVILEFKYLATLPAFFKSAYELFQLTPAGVSKYRRCVAAAGLASEGTGNA